MFVASTTTATAKAYSKQTNPPSNPPRPSPFPLWSTAAVSWNVLVGSHFHSVTNAGGEALSSFMRIKVRKRGGHVPNAIQGAPEIVSSSWPFQLIMPAKPTKALSKRAELACNPPRLGAPAAGNPLRLPTLSELLPETDRRSHPLCRSALTTARALPTPCPIILNLYEPSWRLVKDIEYNQC
jgi:hypothetical protein